MKKLTTALCVALFALSSTAALAADEKKAAKPADKAASAPKAAASAPAATASAPAKKQKKGGC